MPDSKPRIYWDTCVLLSFINGLPERLPDIETLLLEAEKETVELLTLDVEHRGGRFRGCRARSTCA
jgi:hypothetical protein